MPKPAWIENTVSSWSSLPHPIRKTLAATVGVTTLLAGIAMLVLPGPGIAVVLLGLAILATEFAWAKRSLHKVKKHSTELAQKVTKSRGSKNTEKGQQGDE